MRIKQKLINNVKNNFSIILFHGVIKEKKYLIRNYNNKHILDNKFYAVLNYLKKKGYPLDVDEVVYTIKNKKKFPKNSFLISFDDGFENNYKVAAPILDELKIPAVFYFSTDFIENNTMSWIDKIEYCFEKKINKRSLQINKFGKFDISTLEKKIKSLDLIRSKVKSNFKINPEKLVKKIFKEFDMELINNSNADIDKKINWKQINLLNNNALFTLGGHSHLHMPLTYFSEKISKYQISKSINLFKKNANIALRHYSYPEGQKKDFNKKIKSILKEFGIICCPSEINGFNNSKTNLFDLKRIQVI